MQIAAATQASTRAQFSELLERHRGIVLKVAYSYCSHPEDRADLAQEIAAQLWRAFPGYDAERSFPTWMYRIALNVAISHLRNTSHRRQHAIPFEDVLHDIADEGSDPETSEQLRLLHRFIAQQDPFNRALLLLYLEDRSYREIADVLGISEGNIATKISRLKQRMRAVFSS
ncbi:sigma-70 family RNA polymerase sigma factor [Lysobacter sp. Root494]|uniref:RNA polymerase sigma factor n=1 Tax=Lysobacter sp. Root494 TaxID=1736549 RepID=UPI000701FAC9|nr:sigma-70 family RNA polymerase sigma factor [Lysobacter sp. Root494]KQY51758.1 RNA polymerase subunit sigma-70 [Lysobacter sp. Root494]